MVRSRGKKLRASLDDIQSKRALQVRVDDNPVQVGAVIEMYGVAEQLFAKNSWSPFDLNHQARESEAVHRVRYYAAGFPIAVFLNGVELSRPYALDSLNTTRTEIGHVHLRAMHDERYDLPAVRSLRDVRLFLQGLPIGPHKSGSDGCVHLDSTAFTARVPDRTELYDHATQAAKILQGIRDLVSQYLVQMKDVLEPEPFVRRFFSSCREYGVGHLLNDVPFLPLSCFERVSRVDYDTEDVWELCMRYRGPDSEEPLVTRQQFVSGELRAWRDAPSSTENDDCDAPAILKIMQLGDIFKLHDLLDQGHWINKLTPSCNDLQVHVRPVNPGRSGTYTWNADCEVVVADAVEVEVTSRVDMNFSFKHKVTDGWFMVSTEWPVSESSDFSHVISVHERPMLCYVTALNWSNGHPVRVFSDYRCENGTLREDWESSACDYWNSLVSGLLGSSLAEVLNLTSRAVVVSLSKEHQQQLALASVSASRHGSEVVFDDLGGPALWERMASVLGATPVTAQALQQAFFEARKLEALTAQDAAI